MQTLDSTPMKHTQTAMHHAAISAYNFLYGTKERSWLTMGLTLALLVLSVSLMQAGASGGACAV
jgi:hypothetical protein